MTGRLVTNPALINTGLTNVSLYVVKLVSPVEILRWMRHGGWRDIAGSRHLRVFPHLDRDCRRHPTADGNAAGEAIEEGRMKSSKFIGSCGGLFVLSIDCRSRAIPLGLEAAWRCANLAMDNTVSITVQS